MARRIIAQRIKTGEFLSWDVPLQGGKATRELSGPGGITGTITPRVRGLLGPDGLPLLREWSTALYVEEDGRFHGGGIVTRIKETEGQLAVEAPGFSTYPHGIVHATHRKFDLGTDALDVYRYLWDYVQGFPDGDLGVTVDPLKSGEVVDRVEEDSKGKEVRKPYRLRHFEFHDCGEEQDALLDQAVADYTEHHSWNADRTAVNHHINLGVPRLGRKRQDQRFVEGENVIAAVPLTIDGDDFAQNTYGAGRGEGSKMKMSSIAHRDDRLRRTALVIDKNAGQARLDRLTRREYQRRNDTASFESVLVRDHPNARVANIHPGDDILVEATLDWYGRVRHWVRVTAVEASVDDETAVLRVARSDQFRM